METRCLLVLFQITFLFLKRKIGTHLNLRIPLLFDPGNGTLLSWTTLLLSIYFNVSKFKKKKVK